MKRSNDDNQRDHREVFEEAWQDSSNTRIELPPLDVNEVLSSRYHVDESFTVTRDMLWDLEVRKAWRPDRLAIPGSGAVSCSTTRKNL